MFETGDVHIETFVSNPWREAIEASLLKKYTLIRCVSNPWREAIEDSQSLL